MRVAALALLLATTPAQAGLSLAYAPEANLEKLDVALIERARTSIDMAAYVLTDVAVMEALSQAAERGVHVRIYRDAVEAERASGYAAERFAVLAATPGVEIKAKPGRVYMHLKSFAVDRHILRGGAANFSAAGLKTQENDRFETDDPASVAAFETKFEQMWDGGRR